MIKINISDISDEINILHSLISFKVIVADFGSSSKRIPN